MARTLALPAKPFSLASVGDGWQDCYVLYRPLTPRDLLEVASIEPEKMGNQAGTKYVIDMIKSHVAGGKVLLAAANEPVDLANDDIDSLPVAILMDLFTELSGGALDPKDTVTGQPDSTARSNDASSTKTS